MASPSPFDPISRALRDREIHGTETSYLHGHPAFSRRIRSMSRLTGHNGCVNRLSFSADGNLLLSGSDDLCMRIWDVERRQCRASVQTEHLNNIFGVRFLPHSNNEWLASGAMDCQVMLTHVSSDHVPKAWNCHGRSVKTIEVDHSSPHIVISASEDGTVREFDSRESGLRIPNDPISSNIAIRVVENGREVPVKSALMSPVNTNHLLLAADDAYIRIYDRRKSSSSSTSRNTPIGGCIQKFCPAHLVRSAPECSPMTSDRIFSYASYANYSSDGRRAIATYHREHVYLFDLEKGPKRSSGVDGPSLRIPIGKRSDRRMERISHLLETATSSLRNDLNSFAISKLNQVLLVDPSCAAAYLFRAEALLRRKWVADARRALSDIDLLRSSVANNPRCIDELGKVSPLLKKVGKAVLDMMRIRAISGMVVPTGKLVISMRTRTPERQAVYSRLLFLWDTISSFMKDIRPILSAYFTYPEIDTSPEKALPEVDFDKFGVDPEKDLSDLYASPTARLLCEELVSTLVTHPVRIRIRIEKHMTSLKSRPTSSKNPRDVRRFSGWTRTLAALVHLGEDENGNEEARGIGVRAHVNGDADSSEEDKPTPSGTASPGSGVNDLAEPSDNARDQASSSQSPERGSIASRTASPASEPGNLARRSDDDEEDDEAVDGAFGSSRRRRGRERWLKREFRTEDSEEEALECRPRDRGSLAEERESQRSVSRDEKRPQGKRSPGSRPSSSLREGAIIDDEPRNSGSENERSERPSSGKRRRPSNDSRKIAREDLDWAGIEAASEGFWGSSFELGYRACFGGNCNVVTDIKEANFFGCRDQVVMCGSDDGHLYLWDSRTGALIGRLEGDSQIVNCVQGHPFRSLIASSGIDRDVKLWTVKREDDGGGGGGECAQSTEQVFLNNYNAAQTTHTVGLWNLHYHGSGLPEDLTITLTDRAFQEARVGDDRRVIFSSAGTMGGHGEIMDCRLS